MDTTQRLTRNRPEARSVDDPSRPARSSSEREDALLGAFVAHRDLIHTVARRLCGADTAGDVAQEVFIRAWRNPDAYDPARGTMSQYLLTMTRGIAIDHLRRRSAQRTKDSRDASTAESTVDESFDHLVTEQNKHLVVAAVGALPALERDAISAAFFLHLTYQQVAVGLGIPEGTAKSRIRSGLARLRRELAHVLAPPWP